MNIYFSIFTQQKMTLYSIKKCYLVHLTLVSCDLQVDLFSLQGQQLLLLLQELSSHSLSLVLGCLRLANKGRVDENLGGLVVGSFFRRSHRPGGVDGLDLVVQLVELVVGEHVVLVAPRLPQLVQHCSDLLINCLEDVTEVGDQVLLEQFIVRSTNVLTDGVHEVHQGQQLVCLHLLDSVLNDLGDHGRMFDLLLGDLCQGVDDDFIVEGER